MMLRRRIPPCRRFSFFLSRATTPPPAGFFAFLCCCCLLVLSSSGGSGAASAADDDAPPPPSQTCSIADSRHTYDSGDQRDPNLHEMTYDVDVYDADDDDRPREMLKTMVYIEPEVATFYGSKSSGLEKSTPKENTLSAKFINLSHERVSFYWEAYANGKRHAYLMAQVKPFGITGADMIPGHRLVFTKPDKPDAVLKRFEVRPYPENLYYYDPFEANTTTKNLSVLNEEERIKYDKWRKTLRFNQHYRRKTGRSYLANYLRSPPIHFMWPAKYFGQEHWVTTKETHFTKPIPDDRVQATPDAWCDDRENVPASQQSRLLPEYRDSSSETMNMTLKVLSCEPRVFEVENFLSPIEIEHVLEMATGAKLKLSVTGHVDSGGIIEGDVSKWMRSSRNAWVARDGSPIIDAIYRRSADLLRVDEALLRSRTEDDREFPELGSNDTNSLAEHLQLVHYSVGQDYGPHHDFLYTQDIDNEKQDARLVTLLLYLNTVPKGGETSFPRYANAETDGSLLVKPVAGKAVLFYNLLPDGNFDDLSQHAALPVIEGEKWIANLWLHDPIFEDS